MSRDPVGAQPEAKDVGRAPPLADDAPSIGARLKEIEEERKREWQGTKLPEVP